MAVLTMDAAASTIQVRFVVAEDETADTGANRVMRLGSLTPGSEVLVAFTRGVWTRCVIERVDLWRCHVRRVYP